MCWDNSTVYEEKLNPSVCLNYIKQANVHMFVLFTQILIDTHHPHHPKSTQMFLTIPGGYKKLQMV